MWVNELVRSAPKARNNRGPASSKHTEGPDP